MEETQTSETLVFYHNTTTTTTEDLDLELNTVVTL